MQFNKNDMNLQQRIELMAGLGTYMNKNNPEWNDIIHRAFQYNSWFIPEFIDIAVNNINRNFLSKEKLEQWALHYRLDDNISEKEIGIVMAGNIPMVGFHDLLAAFISGHKQTIKLSSKDNILTDHLVKKLHRIEPASKEMIGTSEMLKGCDAYIATGSSNTSRYFEKYFGRFPHIIRRNKTSAGIVTGNESPEELDKLSDDVHLYFGLGCRNITKIYVPSGYDFVPLLRAFDKYKYLSDHHKYNNNYDYQLSIVLLNNVYYMTNETTLLIENKQLFSPISVLHYEFYTSIDEVHTALKKENDLQCIAGKGYLPFGQAQEPDLFTYADNVDTMQFLLTL
jgi:hypothetical protein